MLDDPKLTTRCGACRALRMQGDRGAAAVGALLKTFRCDDLWLRILAAEALAGIGEPARAAVPELLTRLASSDPENDPRNMEQRYLCFALFGRRDGLVGKSLEGVDRELLLKAVRAGLLNEDGRARGDIASVYRNLPFDEIKPLLPEVLKAIAEPAPSGIMFNAVIRMAGLELLAKHHVSEAIELLADYSYKQKKHGSEKRIVTVMEMLKSYGTHAQRAVPRLETAVRYFENEETNYPRRLSKQKAKLVRETIEAIRAATETPRLMYLTPPRKY
jgi:hypothetical protein